MARDETDGTCWQCGAPADPNCVYTQSLIQRAEYADGLGYPVTRTRWGKRVVKVSIPRCQSCEARNYLFGFVTLIGIFVGAVVGGSQFPSRGLTTIVGAAIGSLPAVLLGLYFRRVRGLRSVAAFPPLKQLRELGWEEPG